MKNRTIAKIGLILMFTGFSFGVIETLYYGSNWFPESKGEVVCDSICLIITAIGCGNFIYGITMKIKEDIINSIEGKDANGK